MSKSSNSFLVDCQQPTNPSRKRFLEWREGGVDCVHITLAVWENARETLSSIGKWNRMLSDNGDLIALAHNVKEINLIAKSKRTSVVFGFQNTSPFEDDIDLVEIFHSLGVRIAQLTYNVQNNIASGCWEDEDRGVSKYFGRNIIKEMNRHGMLIDISHCNLKSSFDAVEISNRPIAITHANPQEFVGLDIELNKRNKPTDLINEVIQGGGVLGLSLYPKIMRGGSNATIEDFCNMIDWSVEKFGINSVGLGSDFFSGHNVNIIDWWRAGRWARESPLNAPSAFSPWPKWFQSPKDFPAIFEYLFKKGYKKEDISKIKGENWMRLFKLSFDKK